MAPSPQVRSAFLAMRAIGISESKVKPVLKRLLKLYDKNWELIEEENYRVLADAIFEEEDTKTSDEKENTNKEEGTQVHDEPERPLKRLRKGGHEGLGSSYVINSNSSSAGPMLIKPKMEEEELPGSNSMWQSPEFRKSQSESISPQHQIRDACKQPVSFAPLAVQPNSYQPDPHPMGRFLPSDPHSPQRHPVHKGKEPFVPQPVSKDKTPIMGGALRFKDSVADQGTVVLSKQKVPDTQTLIKPKDEPFTDDVPLNGIPQYETPIAVIHPDSSCKVHRVSSGKSAGQETRASDFSEEDRCANGPASSSEAFAHSELATIPEESPTNLEIATSPMGEEGLMNVTSSISLLKKSPAHSALGVGGSEENNCITVSASTGLADVPYFAGMAASQIPKFPQPLHGLEEYWSSKVVSVNGSNEKGEELGDPELHSLVVVPQCLPSVDQLMFIHNFYDITKAEEVVQISWVNEVNTEYLPAFNYIPQNLIFQNAHVNFTLSQMTTENCCLTCVGDCLTSSTPCVCSHETGSGFAYTPEGLVREDFLENCIAVARDPQQQSFSYCSDCPLERAKNDEILEPCRGHLKRKFIKECWSKCGCHKQCGNRVVQRGIRCKLQVFFTPDGKGWGLRTLEKLAKGAFVCEYAGEILTTKELLERIIQKTRSTNSRKSAYPVLLDSNWALQGALKDEEALCLDATFYGNVARFINHRCLDANLIEIPVKMDTPDHHYYHLAFFTTREVNAFEELTWDYGIDFDDNDHPVKAFQCQCGSKFCRNMKRSSSKCVNLCLAYSWAMTSLLVNDIMSFNGVCAWDIYVCKAALNDV